MRYPMKIESIWAFVAVDECGNEGVCAWYDLRTKTWLPVVAADMDRVNSLRPLARQIAGRTRTRVVLTRFENRADLEEVLP